MGTAWADLLSEAIVGRLPATVVARLNGIDHCIPVVLISGSSPHDTSGIWVKWADPVMRGSSGHSRASAPGSGGRLLQWLISTAQTVEVSFITGEAKVFFDSVIVRRGRMLFRDSRAMLRHPDKVCIIEQRKNAREWVPANAPLTARVLPPGTPAVGAPDAGLAAQLWDISLGGASLMCPSVASVTALKTGDPIGVVVQLHGKPKDLAASHRWLRIGTSDDTRPLRFMATHRWTETLSAHSVRLGLQFVLGEDRDVAGARVEPAVGVAAMDGAAEIRRLTADLERFRIRRQFKSQLRKHGTYAPAGVTDLKD